MSPVYLVRTSVARVILTTHRVTWAELSSVMLLPATLNHHQQSFTGHETIQSMLAFERESIEIGNTIQGYNTDNGVYIAKALMSKLQSNNQTLRLSGVGAHHHNGVAENAIKNISRKARVYMFHDALR